jgi:hypothetical protein
MYQAYGICSTAADDQNTRTERKVHIHTNTKIYFSLTAHIRQQSGEYDCAVVI